MQQRKYGPDARPAGERCGANGCGRAG
eukprot:SAG22_NODE_2019_length_3129_cov_1.934653_1_plen_26_part_10